MSSGVVFGWVMSSRGHLHWSSLRGRLRGVMSSGVVFGSRLRGSSSRGHLRVGDVFAGRLRGGVLRFSSGGRLRGVVLAWFVFGLVFLGFPGAFCIS
ncbi:hypothetical protein BDZ89DRAFT_82570 [Hymenopellis radicata]|nr:hypothetical protein BDZ89DRAFT_82054 [Hymenopellis radicata]KAF9025330.1 hypothetical protein BDZ89DRAFT_82570 [Hymenopellis radicata]